MEETESRKAWILRVSPQKYRDICLDRNILAVGWSAARNLNQIHDWDEFKQHIRENHQEIYESNRALGNAAGSVWRFVHAINEGDIVIVPSDNGFYMAQVESEIQWSEADFDDDFSWQRRVSWLKKEPIPRSQADNYLRRRLKARQTCVDASDLLSEIEDARKRGSSLSLVNEIREATLETVMHKIDHALDNKGLEHLVCALVQASGVHAEVLPNRQEEEGDVDVLANLQVPIPETVMGGQTEIRIGYQVKHHDGATGVEGLDQIVTALDGGKIDYGFLVTSAEDFDEEVKGRILTPLDSKPETHSSAASTAPAEIYQKIGLINRKLLAEWLLNVGLENTDIAKIRM